MSAGPYSTGNQPESASREDIVAVSEDIVAVIRAHRDGVSEREPELAAVFAFVENDHRCSHDSHDHDCYYEWTLLRGEILRLIGEDVTDG